MRVLIADDEPELLELLNISLQNSEWIIDTASEIDEVKSYLDAYSYSMFIVDRTFHGTDHIQELIRYSKNKNASMGILVLSAMGSIDDKVQGLEYGADDYLEKPFDIKELRARLLALKRRYAPNVKFFEGIEVDLQNKTIKKDGISIILSATEQSVFFYLIERGRISSREEIMDAIYDNPQNITSNAIDELIGRIRRKVHPSIIKTIKTRGYLIEF